jgi:hypothetical protein
MVNLIGSLLEKLYVTLDMNEKTVKCQYLELLGDYGTNIWSVATQLVVFPISEEYRNKQGEEVEKRRKEKIEEFNNIQIINKVRIPNKSISVNETEFDKKPHDDDKDKKPQDDDKDKKPHDDDKDKKPDDDDKAQTYVRSSCNSSGSDFWFLLTLLYFVTFFQ